MIPIVLVLPSGRERVIGQASDMESAERLAARLLPLYRGRKIYIDCTRHLGQLLRGHTTTEEVKAGGYVNGDPRDEKANPPTKVAADGTSTLRRYRVDAVIYAPSLAEAHRRLKYDMHLDAASIEGSEA